MHGLLVGLLVGNILAQLMLGLWSNYRRHAPPMSVFAMIRKGAITGIFSCVLMLIINLVYPLPL